MTDATHEELLSVELLITNEKYKDALKLIKKFSQREGISPNDQLAAKLLESRIRVQTGKIDEAGKLIEKIWPKVSKQKNPLLILDYLIVKAHISWVSGQLEEGTEVLTKCKEFLEKQVLEFEGEMKVRFLRRKCALLQHAGIINWYKGDLDKALEFHLESLRIHEKLGNKSGIVSSYNNLGLVCWSKSDYKQAIEYYKKSLTLSEELGKKLMIGRILNNLGNVYLQQGDLNQALEYYQQSHVIKEEKGTKQDIIISFINLGVVHQFKGELEKSLNYYQKALVLSEEVGYKQHIALAVNNIGNIYSLKGDIDQAFEYYKRSFELYKELDMKQQIAMSHLNVGGYHQKKGNRKEALEHYHQSLVIYEELGNDFSSALVIYELILEALENNDTTSMNQYLLKLQQIYERTDSRSINQHYRVAHALTLKASDNKRERVKAIVIFEQVIEEEITDHSLTVTAMVHLCELLLSELKVTGDNELFKEIKNLTHKLLEIAEKQSSHSLLAETYRLEALLALAELDLKKAKQLLKNALNIADEKGLEKTAAKIRDEQQELEEHIDLWEELSNRKAPLEETLQHVHIEETIKEMQDNEIIAHKRLFSFKI